MVLVNLITWHLFQSGENVSDLKNGVVLDWIKRIRGEIDKKQQVFLSKKSYHLTQLVRITGGAGVISQLTLPSARSIQGEKVLLHGGYRVEDALASILQLSFRAC